MDNRELRIGNYVDYEKTTHVIKGVSSDKVFSYWLKGNDISDEYMTDYNSIEPIDLSKEWLIKFGFTSVDDSYFYKKIGEFNEINIDLESNDVRHDSHWICELEYVHQLQNLYYFLTGKEL